MEQAEPLIAIENVSYAVGEKSILDGINLQIRRGEFVSLIGPNGAGKSTLLKSLVRLIRGRGEIVFDGKPLSSYRQRELARKMAYVPQAEHRSTPFTVEEFILMGRYPYSSAFSPLTPEDRRVAADSIEELGLGELRERFMYTLSGGERQKVLIAAALTQEPEVLLLDEPASFLDPRHEAETYRVLQRLHRERGMSVIAVTHDVNRAALVSEHVIALKNGAVVFDGSPELLLTAEMLQMIYETSFLFVEHPEVNRKIVVSRGI